MNIYFTLEYFNCTALLLTYNCSCIFIRHGVIPYMDVFYMRVSFLSNGLKQRL